MYGEGGDTYQALAGISSEFSVSDIHKPQHVAAFFHDRDLQKQKTLLLQENRAMPQLFFSV